MTFEILRDLENFHRSNQVAKFFIVLYRDLLSRKEYLYNTTMAYFFIFLVTKVGMEIVQGLQIVFLLLCTYLTMHRQYSSSIFLRKENRPNNRQNSLDAYSGTFLSILL